MKECEIWNFPHKTTYQLIREEEEYTQVLEYELSSVSNAISTSSWTILEAHFGTFINFLLLKFYVKIGSPCSIPRQVEKFWTGTDWEIFLGGIWGGLLTSTENLENFGNSWGGTGSKLGWDTLAQNFSGGVHPQSSQGYCRGMRPLNYSFFLVFAYNLCTIQISYSEFPENRLKC